MSSRFARALQLNLSAQVEVGNKPLSSISRTPVVYINEMLASGGVCNAAICAAIEAIDAAGNAAACDARVLVRIGPNGFARPGLPPKRPPDKLKKPSTRCLKKS